MPNKKQPASVVKPGGEEGDHGTQYESDGRKAQDLERVGGLSPDSDAEEVPAPPEDHRRKD